MKGQPKRLSYLKMASEVQAVAQPLLRTGRYSMRAIYHNYILPSFPISLNTLRKMLMEDVTNLGQLIETYRQQQLERYEEELERRRSKRLLK